MAAGLLLTFLRDPESGRVRHLVVEQTVYEKLDG